MRDDNRNHRPNDPYRRAPAGGGNGQGGDPLAELARLIGQNDPFSDFARDQGRAPAPAQMQMPAQDPRYPEPAPAAEWQAQPDPYRGMPQSQPAPQYAGAPAPQGNGFRPAPGDQHGYSESYRDAPMPGRQYAPPDYAQTAFSGGHNHDQQQYDDPRYAAYGADQYGYPPQSPYGQQGQQGYGSDPYYRGMPHDEDMYEDRPRARKRGSMLTVMAVLALAVVGTAAAFGYRALFSSSGTGTPPTIRADAGPNKVVPAGADASNKLQDRVGDRSQQERVVSREEQPVDLKNATPPPRVVLSAGLPNPVAPTPNTITPAAPAYAAPAAQQAAAVAPAPAAGAASTEPKKIRTLSIRPDQPSAAPETPVTRSASAVPQEQPMPATATVRTTTIRAPQQQQAQADPNAPLSLVPNSSAQRAGTMRTASAPSSQPMATSSGGAYSVQVTSQRSEAEAQSSYQALQAKYPSVLGSRQAMIRRADLGDKGTYYRAQVPFGSQSEASEFCASLKAAGGQCVVQRN